MGPNRYPGGQELLFCRQNFHVKARVSFGEGNLQKKKKGILIKCVTYTPLLYHVRMSLGSWTRSGFRYILESCYRVNNSVRARCACAVEYLLKYVNASSSSSPSPVEKSWELFCEHRGRGTRRHDDFSYIL